MDLFIQTTIFDETNIKWSENVRNEKKPVISGTRCKSKNGEKLNKPVLSDWNTIFFLFSFENEIRFVQQMLKEILPQLAYGWQKINPKLSKVGQK